MRITLIGSTRFREQFEQANRALTLEGHLVYSVGFFVNSGEEVSEEDKERLDAVHLEKILEADLVILIPGPDSSRPYIGDSTRRELRFVHQMKIPMNVWVGPTVEDLWAPPELIAANGHRLP